MKVITRSGGLNIASRIDASCAEVAGGAFHERLATSRIARARRGITARTEEQLSNSESSDDSDHDTCRRTALQARAE